MKLNRRKFLASSGISAAHLALFGLPNLPIQARHIQGRHGQPQTIQQVIDSIVALVPGAPFSQTVDTIKTGDGTQDCKGIVTTFMATAPVIQQAIDLKANLIITHEPTFYNHLDETDWLENDVVYKFKRNLLEANEIVVWRFHDYWHSINPDGILKGITDLLDWNSYQAEPNSVYFNLPATTLGNLAARLKNTMGLKRPYLVGNPQMQTSKIALLPGSWGGRPHIETFMNSDIDTLIVGEINEWETNEYVRDANFAGLNKGLIILGHAISEEPGMNYLTSWLKPLTGSIPINHVPAGDALQAI